MTVDCVCGQRYDATGTGTVSIVRCPACGTGATIPPPGRDVHGDGLFEDADAGYGGDRLALRDQWFREARLRLAWMATTLAAGSRVLELGAATGEFVATAEHAGHRVVGLETSPLAARAAADVTPNVHNADLDTWRREHAEEQMDAVVLFHVLEHVPEPLDLLEGIRETLRPGGRVYAEVPNGGSFGARRDGVRWWAARVEDHVFHFTVEGARALFGRGGFELETISAVHRDVYADRRTLVSGLVKDAVRPLVGKGRRSLDLLRVVARRPAGG